MTSGIILRVFHMYYSFFFELVVTVADETDVKEARSFSSAWRKSNEPAADRKAHKTRGAHGWLDPDKDFPFHPRRRGEQTCTRYIYTHTHKYYERRKKRNGRNETKRNVLASVEADSVVRRQQLGGGLGERAEISREGERIIPSNANIQRSPRGLFLIIVYYRDDVTDWLRFALARIVPSGGLRQKGLILRRARAFDATKKPSADPVSTF